MNRIEFVITSLTIAACLFHNESASQWIQTGGPLGGPVDCITIGPNGRDLFAGTAGGVFRSTDAGASWSSSSRGFPGNWVLAFAVVGPNLFAGSYTNGVFRSTDNGATWAGPNVTQPNRPEQFAALSIVGLGTTLFACCNDQGVFASSNMGKDWTPVDSGLTSKIVWSLSTNGSDIFAGTARGLFVSGDSGKSWVESDSGLPKNPDVISIAADGPEIFAAVYDVAGNHNGGVFRSVDTGKIWNSASSGLAGIDVFVLFNSDGRLFAGTDSGVFFSDDHGGNWVCAARTSLYATAINGFARSEDGIFAGTAAGVFCSTDNGQNWSPAGPGIIATQVFTMAKGNGEILAGGYQGIWSTTNCGTTWTDVDKSLARYEIQSILISGTTLFVGTRYGGGFRSSDHGRTWSVAISTHGPSEYWVRSLRQFGANIFAGLGSYLVQRSTDNGVSWNPLLGGPNDVWCFAADGGNLFAGGRYGITRSSNDGISWTKADTGAGWSIAALAVVGEKIFAGSQGNGVFVSTNNGSRWNKIDSGLTDLVIDCFAVSGNNLFAGTMGGGIFLLTIPDTVWTTVNSVSEGNWNGSAGSMNSWINDLFVSDGLLLAGTEKTGVWKRPLSEMVTALGAKGAEAPVSFHLFQNYPNPFNPGTTIRYELPSTSMVRVGVFDILGREVAVLVNERKEAGSHEVKFDGSYLASGVYFYRMQAGSFVQTRKLLLVK